MTRRQDSLLSHVKNRNSRNVTKALNLSGIMTNDHLSKSWTFSKIKKICPDRIFNPKREDISGKNRTYGNPSVWIHVAFINPKIKTSNDLDQDYFSEIYLYLM